LLHRSILAQDVHLHNLWVVPMLKEAVKTSLCYHKHMTRQAKSSLLRMDNVGIVVDDMKAAVAFFAELGLEVVGEATVEGPWVDQVVGLDRTRSDIVMMRTPDGHSQLELTKFQTPAAIKTDPNMPENTLGRFRIMFAVTDIDDVVARLKKHGAELVGEIAQYQDMYRLCYLRGPEGITVAVAEQLGNQ
jgi:catechol 2,3-dioxygenase-like lactoylglutathione lyase family enzyme